MDKNEGGLPDSKLKKGNFVDFNAAVSSPSMDHIQLYELANVPKEPNIPFQNKRNGDNKIILDSYTLVDNDFNKSTNNLKEPAKPIILPSLQPNEPNVLFMGKSKNTTQEQAKTDSLQNKLDDNKSIVKNFLNGIEQKFIKATNNSEQDTKYQQNNDKEMKNSSFIGSSINTIKIIIEPKGFPDDNGETVEIIFHVHLPKFSFGGEPAILGSIEELGNWQKSNVKLKPYNKGRSSYWYSEPINIPIKRFENVIKYKYAINTLLKSFQYEGTSSNDNRELKIKNQNFDIWRNNSTHGINKITDYMFLDIIFESVTLENIKEMIIEYNGILNKYSELTFSITNIQFISKQLLDNSIGIGKRLFLCFLLGHCDYRLELQRDFQTVPLLQAFFTVHSDTFPFDSWKIVFKGIDLLIHHNINNGLYEWLKIFTITRYARYVDFEFDSVSFANCNDDSYIENCFKIILELEFDESAHMKIIKWLLRQCKNMKMVLIVWQSSNKSDELLRQLFVENTKKIISKANLVDLYENLTMLSDDIRDKVAYQFRERVLNLLNGHRSAILDNSEFKSIFTLLISVHLGWTKVDYINVLETVSTFEDYQLLNVFPSFLKYWIKMPNDFDDIISQICIQWYKNLMNRMDSTAHKGEYVTVVFEKLSSICSLINEPRISDALMEITFNRIRPSSEQSIFNTVSIVLKFCSEAVQVLTKVIIEKIDSMELGCGELLLKKMLVICGCTGKILNIPNEFCEITLLYILSRLQQSSSKPYSKESLNDCAIFWIVILRATGSTNMFHSHKLVQETRTSIFRLACVIKNRSINIQQLQDLLNFNDYFLYAYLNSAHNNREIITMDTLAIVRHKCQIYEHRLKFLDDFYKRFCPIQKTKDVQNYLDELIERSKKLNEISIKESLSKTHWEFHNEIISIAESTSELNKSQVFYNVFDKHLNDVSKESSDDVSKVLDVKFIARKLMKDVLKEYVSRCKQYERWEDLEYSKEISFWYKVSNFDVELKLLEKHSNIQISKGDAFMMTLKYLSRYKDWKERTENLLKVTKIIRVKANWLDDLFNHERLGTLSNSIEIINQKFSKFNDNSWGFTKELTRSQEFIAFLKCKSDDDLKNLINGVDEHSDTRLIQEGTISSLIQVKQFMNPFMNDPSFTLDALIKKLSNINPSLASKLALCNSNVRALINMYKSTYNKGEVSKEKIQNAVKVGTYGFTKKEMDEDCILELSYPSKLEETIKLNINELQDLRSRALLSSKPCASIGQIDDDFAEIKARMEEFVIQVDIAQSIIITMKKLTQLGHFGYRKYNESVRVNRAQGDCYYLTFYPARHILALYDYYTKSRECLEITETCQILVSFVNRKAKLPRQNDIGFNCNKSEYDLVLREINGRLEDIFGTLQKHARLLKISVKIKCGELFVATCDDKSKVPNIIMSFYANHGYYPEPWQLLICTTSTTEEELSIFIKRCYLASKNGYKGHLFCIANLEILDFELQYYLVNRIKSFTEKVDFYLALICCSVIGMHNHIVDQFSENIHTADGLDTIAMRSIYRKLCPKVTCVTSELSGQGKTQFIKQEISKNKKNMVTFLISDGASFNSLIRQLKKSHIQKDDSLHINIISADNPGEINLFLFQLLTLRIISNNADIISLPDSYIYIEVAGNCLIESLPFLDCLNNLHLIWNINRLMVTKDVQSPIQVVCRYLDLYDRNMLDKQDIVDFNVLLDQKYCQQLLDRYFFKKIDSSILSFRFLEIFVNLLADQLFRLSESPFFTVENLKFMTKDVNIRSTLFNILLDVSIDFATKSIKTKSAQLQSISDRAAEVDQLGNLVQWDDSNHLLVFFMSQSPESICALYRNKNIVPNNVTNLLKSQSFELADYQTMSSDQLLITLECLARKTMHKINYTQYALSTDNLLKMALMLLRTRANIPVVICGDAGCGKTSLISFLAKVVEVEFYALNLHAGIKEKDIKDFMNESHKKALISEIWLFFDEINTCNHIGLLAELIAHRKLDGKTIHHNIRLFAACNPYRIRNKSVSSVGLKSKKIGFEQQNKGLVYEVKPLPDQILDYVWDYGTIRPQDEMTYIQLMIHEAKLSSIFAELLFSSQEFIRNVEEPYSVSLRDVKRAIKLVNFFNGSLSIRQNENNVYPDNSFDILTRSYILALGLCYQSRLCDHELRIKYRNKMCEIFKNIDDSQFKKIIRDEQMDLMKRMICPPNIAFNEALLENVLAVIVCICCKIPLFIVGSPGSSKSLAIRLVYQNLRGHDSNDTYFRTLPLVFLIPHQGSSSSTSDGIEIVFQKANAYQKTCSKDFLVISVVLLDEIGLAEISPHNPLKVLHSLLEPSYPDDGPTVSVIGISNWRLDNSKNSRALLVQRPNFELNNLVETAVSLHIHPDFRCILVLDNEKLNNADPPLLNRFEKQQMTIKDILNKDEKELVNKLREWTRQMTIIVGTEEKNLDFTTEEVFIGYNKEETLESLIIDIKIKDPGMKDGELLEKCKENLVATATSDGMIRVKKSTLHFEEIQHLKNIYFQTQHHDDLADYFQDLLQEQTVQDGHLVIINTFSNINTDASDLYFNDFVNVVCSNEQKAKNTFVLSRLIQCKLCKEMIKNPINLHIFWWNNASSTLAAFRLISECPSIFNEELFNAKNLEQRIVNEVTKLMLNSLSICQEIVELQLQFRNILNFCENLTSFKRTKSFQMLTFCHELLSTESIPLEIIKEIIEIRDEEDMFTKMHINRIFEILSKIEPDNTLIAKQSFIIKCCEIFPYDSPLKLELYHTLFLEDPFHLRGQTIKSILEKENKNNSFESFMWLDHPRKMMNLPLFKIMNTCLEKNGCQSTIAALFCDIIQKAYFTRYNLIELSTYYHCAIEALCADNVAGLHLITAIAFLKEFVHEFWKFLIQDNILKPVELDFNGVDERIIELINKINCDLNSDFRLVDSLKFYFLRDLRNRGSMSDVHKFCQAQKHIFPWLENLPWDNNQETRLQFDVYNSIEDYSIVERNFARFFYYRNSLELFNEIFNKISRKEETSARISLMGGIFNQLHIIRATREWNLNEESAATHLKKRIKKASYFSKVYKIIIQNVITNKMSILQIDTNASNSDILIKSVIGHVVALHSSIPAEVSPLAYMQHNLDYCSDLYILTCLSDVESVLLNANLQQEKKYTRYRCKCGYPYLIGDCGGVNEQSKCPECKNTIGNGQPEAGNVRLDSKPIKTDRKVKDEKGYIREEINRDIHHNVRNLSPTSYRILHLFVHSIIGAWAPSDIVTKFSQNISNGSVEYCMEHIRNDWSILLNRLNCSEEDLALLLHAILDRMFLIPPNHHTTLKEPQEREEWETNFSQDYVVPLIKNIRNTITEFRVKLANTKISDELLEKFPESLLVGHIYAAYEYASFKIR
ncbi:7188_t:CDS:10 [Funneliformis geosporum]|uniref:7188_t:CDS:1 n=1 Tax=Funneliformis geosporum TaxID=1117311 RepID=A0A9W4WTE7_9GLOM|nr:7188_t:CDS:10 [Funneliformis geosporum]